MLLCKVYRVTHHCECFSGANWSQGSLGRGDSCIKLKIRQITFNIPRNAKNLCFCYLAFLLLELLENNL